MASDYDLASDWLNSNASAFIPENASWITLEELDGLTIQAADNETLVAMMIAVDLAFKTYGEHSIPLAATRDNYLIVVEDALDAATTLGPETSH